MKLSLVFLTKKVLSPAGNRTPVFRVTGGDTHHYTTEDDEQSGCKMQMKLQFSTRQKEKRHSRAGNRTPAAAVRAPNPNH